MPPYPDPKEVALRAPAGHAPGWRHPRRGLTVAGTGKVSAAPGAALRMMLLLCACGVGVQPPKLARTTMLP